jgi:hypothetical protein
VQESDLVRYAELRAFPIIRCDLCGTQEDYKRKQKRNFCADGRGSRLAVQTASSPPCRTWRRRSSWTDGCSTSWVCAHPTRRKGRKTPGWIKTLAHAHEPHKFGESLGYQRHLTNARISPQKSCNPWRTRHCVELRNSLYTTSYFCRQVVIRGTLSRF